MLKEFRETIIYRIRKRKLTNTFVCTNEGHNAASEDPRCTILLGCKSCRTGKLSQYPAANRQLALVRSYYTMIYDCQKIIRIRDALISENDEKDTFCVFRKHLQSTSNELCVKCPQPAAPPTPLIAPR